MEMGLQIVEAGFYVFRYAGEGPAFLDMSVGIPLRDLVQSLNSCAVKKIQNLLHSRPSIYGLLPHYFIIPNPNMAVTFGHFGGILFKKWNGFLTHPPDFRARFVREFQAQKLMPWEAEVFFFYNCLPPGVLASNESPNKFASKGKVYKFRRFDSQPSFLMRLNDLLPAYQVIYIFFQFSLLAKEIDRGEHPFYYENWQGLA